MNYWKREGSVTGPRPGLGGTAPGAPPPVYLEDPNDPLRPTTRDGSATRNWYLQEDNKDEMTEVTPNNTPNTWAIIKFKVSLWFACLMTGRLPIYNLLLAQALLETANYTSHGFKVRLNGFGMRPSAPNLGAPNAVRLRTKWWTREDNGFAAYPSYYAGCRDRIDLDQFNEITPTSVRPSDMTLEQWYMEAVLDAGYVPAAERSSYMTGWKAKLGSAEMQKGGNTPVWMLLLMLGITATLVILIVRWYKKRKRKATGSTGRKWWSKLRRSRKAKA